jgi:UDP-D-galactose:(glucosyl)LPS alpha-1,6-D-galactosyltransferase
MRALALCSDLDWRLDFVGDGPMHGPWRALARSLGIDSRIAFHGSLPNASARSVIAASDLLVLPSRRVEGWGAVLNEA